MSVPGQRWQARKGQGHFVPRSELSVQQQTLLAAVPRWKREWVKPTPINGKASTSTYMIRKWVLDTSAGREEGTEEEMAEALKIVASGVVGVEGDVTPSITTGVGESGISGTVTPALMEDEVEIIATNEMEVEQEVPRPHPLSTVTAVATPEVSTPLLQDTDTAMLDESAAPLPSPAAPVSTIATPPIPASEPSPIPTPPPLPVALNPAKPDVGPPEIIDTSLPPAMNAVVALLEEPLLPSMEMDVEVPMVVEDEVKLAAEALLPVEKALEEA